MSEMEPHKRAKKSIAPRHIPQLIVPIPLADARDFVRSALTGTSLADPVAQVLTGWVFFEPYLRFEAVDSAHTRIELDVVGRLPGVEALLYTRRRGEIDRFFVAIRDELERRDRWRPPRPADDQAIDGPSDSAGPVH